MLAVACIFAGTGSAAAQQALEQRVQTLEERVAELEAQNRELMALLHELARTQSADRPAPAVLAAAPDPAPAPPAAAVAQPPGMTGVEEEPRLPNELRVGESRLALYGFVRLDAIYDDSRPDHPQFPGFILSEDPSAGPEGDGQLSLHPRLTRLGLSYRGPELGGLGSATLDGGIEIDFQNGGRESREIIRMRHGWLKLSWEEWSLLAGQTWDAFSPLYPTVNSDSLMWNAGNLGDRRPQVRLAREPEGGAVSFVAGIGLTGAVDSQDLDSDGVRDGEDSSLPNVQARIGFSGSRGARDGGWEIGLWGHYGREETTVPVAGETRFRTSSLGLDYQLGLTDRLRLKGEAWTGRNLSDFRGGIGQGVNAVTGDEIASRGGWVELGLQLAGGYSLYGGLTLDDPDDDDVPPGGRTENRTWYLVNRFPIGRSFLLGLDYLRWATEYRGLADGTDNRFNLYLVYDF